MYNEQDLVNVRTQQKKRWIMLAVPLAVLLIGICVALCLRGPDRIPDATLQIAVDVMSVLIAVLLIGGWGLLIKPLHCYEKLLNGLLHGMRHETGECTFLRFEPDTSMVEGVKYYSMIVTGTDAKGKPCEQLFYYDAEKRLPDLHEGDKVQVTYHDRMVGDLKIL